MICLKQRGPKWVPFFLFLCHKAEPSFISFDMIYAEDVKKIFKQKTELFGGAEISVFDSEALVVSGHKGLLSLSSEEVVVRLKTGCLRVLGGGLSVLKASPSEIYLSGAIRALEFPEEIS